MSIVERENHYNKSITDEEKMMEEIYILSNSLSEKERSIAELQRELNSKVKIIIDINK